MPRDLFPTGNAGQQGADDTFAASTLAPLVRNTEAIHDPSSELHLFTQVLGTPDVDSCVILEEMAFPPQERCTRSKFLYRFKACNELSLGLFTSTPTVSLPTTQTALPVETRDPDRRAVLLGHIVATKTRGQSVTDDDMALPDPANPDPKLGHKQDGRTVCIHSLAVLPHFQGKGFGTLLMTAYLDRLRSSGVADSVAIIAHDHLIGYYSRFGFVSQGPSQAQFGGGGWFDMLLKL